MSASEKERKQSKIIGIKVSLALTWLLFMIILLYQMVAAPNESIGETSRGEITNLLLAFPIATITAYYFGGKAGMQILIDDASPIIQGIKTMGLIYYSAAFVVLLFSFANQSLEMWIPLLVYVMVSGAIFALISGLIFSYIITNFY